MAEQTYYATYVRQIFMAEQTALLDYSNYTGALIKNFNISCEIINAIF